MRFTKMHALGNDFVVAEREALPSAPPLDELARRLCERHTGVGADGLLVLGPRESDDSWRVEIRNADGSRASACGNGARCLARYLGPGEHVLRTEAEDVRVVWDGALASVRLRAPRVLRRSVVALRRGDVAVRIVDVGNPHAVVLGIDPADSDLAEVASTVRGALGDANVEIVALDGKDALRMRVDERGVGETLACGTGACAAAVAARVEGWIGDRATVRVPGGELDVRIERDAVVLTGPANESFRGEWTA